MSGGLSLMRGIEPAFSAGAHRGACGARRLALLEPDMTAGQNHTGGQTLEVPFPWSRKCFIEVIDVEDQAALRRSKATEVGEVGIAAGLHREARAWGVGKVSGHDRGRAAIKGERRL